MAVEEGIATIQIFAELHPQLKERAAQARMPLRDYTSRILQECIARLEFLERVAPSLYVLKSQPDRINIMETTSKEDRIVRVGIKDRKVFCESCEADDCKHVHFVLVYPDLKELAEKISEL